jgi:hypothetical protein
LEVSDKLQEYLNKFKTIDDFRVDDEPVNDAQGAGSLKQANVGNNKKRHRTSSDNDSTATTTTTTNIQNDATH